jgi:hypothetical protein
MTVKLPLRSLLRRDDTVYKIRPENDAALY